MRNFKKPIVHTRRFQHRQVVPSAAPKLIDTIPVGLHQYKLQPGGELIFIGGNPAANRILGIDHQVLIGKPIQEAFPNLAQTDIPDAYRRVARNGGSFERELVTYQDERLGGIFKVQAFQTGPDCMAALFQDISDKKETERALGESENCYRRLFEDTSLGVFQSSPEGKALAVNPAFARMFGYDSPEDVLVTVQNVATEIFANPNRRAEIAQTIAANPEQKLFENIYRRKDGSTFPGTLHLHPVKDSEGRLLYFEGMIEDISERVQAQKKIHDLAKFPNENPFPVARISSEGVLLFANQTATQLITSNGLEIGQSLPQNMKDDLIQLYNNGQNIELEIQQDGKIYAVQMVPVLGESYINIYGLDISKRKQAEIALQESEQQLRSLIEQCA